ncbi:MAG: OmpA family protein [Bacteroidota bacterium]
MRTNALLLLGFTLLLVANLSGQGDGVEATPIQLRNPSFEDMPRNSMPPIGWTDCGWTTETAPDVQPDPLNQFRVTMQAQDGNTYLGMVVRDNDTWERVGQELNEPMMAGQCYAFRIQLARSRVYLSQSRIDNRPANYVTPARLRIWGGYDLCDRNSIIGETGLISNFNWQEYKLKLKPQEDFSHIILEVFYRSPTLIPYNGNLLLDNASPLVPMDCEEEIPPSVVMIDEPPLIEPAPESITKKGVESSGPTENPTPEPEPAIKTYKLGETEAKIALNTVFQVPEITFKSNSAEIALNSRRALEDIIGFLRTNPEVFVEIGGHASSQAGDLYAKQISLSRAKAVVKYLEQNGIDSNRLTPFGYGKQRRLCMEKTDACRRRNQRVEVKIIQLDEEENEGE